MDFLFFFFYGLFKRYDNDPKFTSILAVFIIISLYLITLLKALVRLKLIDNFPSFSETYYYNKLAWTFVALPFCFLVILYFDKKKVKTIIEKYQSIDTFYDFKRLGLFVLIFGLPILGLVKL